MKRLFFISFFLILSLSSFIPRQKPNLDFLIDQNKSAKDYVINLFKTNDIVVLSERDHKEFTQYELFVEIAKRVRITLFVSFTFVLPLSQL